MRFSGFKGPGDALPAPLDRISEEPLPAHERCPMTRWISNTAVCAMAGSPGAGKELDHPRRAGHTPGSQVRLNEAVAVSPRVSFASTVWVAFLPSGTLNVQEKLPTVFDLQVEGVVVILSPLK